MKKFVAILLTLMLVLGVSAAFAEGTEETPSPTTTTASLGKVVVISEGAVMPGETFNFTIENDGVTDAAEGVTTQNMPTPTLGSATFNAGADGSEVAIPITLPTYQSVGIYTYTIKETAGATAGMTYSNAVLTLKVTVLNDENGGFMIAGTSLVGSDDKKHDTFQNTYSAGSLKVTKTVTGNLGDKDKYFEFKVTLTGEASKTYGNPYKVTGGSYANNPKEVTIVAGERKEYTFMLKHGETISIANLPYGVGYTVTETPADGYTTTKTGNDGSINAKETTVAFENKKTGEIDTGVTTESLPYVVLMGFVVLAGAALLLKRKAHNN